MTRKDRRTQHRSKQERENKERSINGGGKVVTPSVRSRRQRGLSKTKRGAGKMKQLSGEALTVLDQSAARKARYQVKETRKQKQRETRGRGC